MYQDTTSPSLAGLLGRKEVSKECSYLTFCSHDSCIYTCFNWLPLLIKIVRICPYSHKLFEGGFLTLFLHVGKALGKGMTPGTQNFLLLKTSQLHFDLYFTNFFNGRILLSK